MTEINPGTAVRDNPLWAPGPLDGLENAAAARGQFGGRADVWLIDLAPELADAWPDHVVDGVGAVVFLPDNAAGYPDPWLVHPDFVLGGGWVATQARIDPATGQWQPIPATTGVLGGPDTSPDALLDTLTGAAELPAPASAPAGTPPVSTRRAHTDLDVDHLAYIDIRHWAQRDHQSRVEFAADVDAAATGLWHARGVGAWLTDLVADLTLAGVPIHACNAPVGTAPYRAGGVCLTPNGPGGTGGLLLTWHTHPAAENLHVHDAQRRAGAARWLLADAVADALTAAGWVVERTGEHRTPLVTGARTIPAGADDGQADDDRDSDQP